MFKCFARHQPLLIKKVLIIFLLFHLVPSLSWCASKSPKNNKAKIEQAVSSTDDAEETSSDLSLGDLNNTEVVYSASKSEQKTTDAPGTTTILTSSEIKVGGFRTLDDLLNYVRGFYVTSDRDYSYVGLRGFGSLGGYNSRVLLLVDGHRINDNVYGQFYTGEDSIVDMEIVDHVEIIRGPASVQFGSSAVFGVINVVTKKGKDNKGWTLSTQGGSLKTIGAGIQFGGVDDSGFQWSGHGSAFTSGGNENLYFPEYNSLSTNNGIAQNCDGENSQHLFLSLGDADLKFEGSLMHRFKVVPTGVFDTAFNNPNTYSDDLNAFAELDYQHGDPEGGQWAGRLYLDVSDYWGNYVSASSGVSNIDVGDGAWWGTDLHYTVVPFARNKITLGAEFVDNFQQLQRNYDLGVTPAYLDDSRQSTELAFYVQDEIKLFSNLLFNAGGRYDYFSTTGGQLIPRGSLIWQPFPTTVLKLIAGEGFRAPGPFELYYQDNGISQEPNPNLKNEVFQTYEFDWEQTFLQDHRFIFSLFRYAGDNLILGMLDPNTSLLVYDNIGHASVNGLEVEYQFHNSGGIQGRLSWAYQRAQDDITGQVLPDSPQVLGKASLQIPIDAKHLTVAGECQFTGASYGFTGVWAEDYAVFNLKLYSPHFIKENLEANLAVYNLFDQRYYQPVSNALQELTLQQNGLVIWARLGLKL